MAFTAAYGPRAPLLRSSSRFVVCSDRSPTLMRAAVLFSRGVQTLRCEEEWEPGEPGRCGRVADVQDGQTAQGPVHPRSRKLRGSAPRAGACWRRGRRRHGEVRRARDQPAGPRAAEVRRCGPRGGPDGQEQEVAGTSGGCGCVTPRPPPGMSCSPAAGRTRQRTTASDSSKRGETPEQSDRALPAQRWTSALCLAGRDRAPHRPRRRLGARVRQHFLHVGTH